MPATLTPRLLDEAAARLLGPGRPLDRAQAEAWRGITHGYRRTAPADPAARRLVTRTVPELVEEALRQVPVAPPAERPLPGRWAAVLPDRLQQWRGIGQGDIKPSVQLGYARQVLQEWGWQQRPYKLRDARGARCVCGAILTAHRLGHGSLTTSHTAAAWVLTELRQGHDWYDLIGPWNRAPGRTAAQAIGLVEAAARRAREAGE